MRHEFQTKPEFPYGGTGNEAAGRASHSPPPTTAAATQLETDLIMEALVREYLNGAHVGTESGRISHPASGRISQAELLSRVPDNGNLGRQQPKNGDLPDGYRDRRREASGLFKDWMTCQGCGPRHQQLLEHCPGRSAAGTAVRVPRWFLTGSMIAADHAPDEVRRGHSRECPA